VTIAGEIQRHCRATWSRGGVTDGEARITDGPNEIWSLERTRNDGVTLAANCADGRTDTRGTVDTEWRNEQCSDWTHKLTHTRRGPASQWATHAGERRGEIVRESRRASRSASIDPNIWLTCSPVLRPADQGDLRPDLSSPSGLRPSLSAPNIYGRPVTLSHGNKQRAAASLPTMSSDYYLHGAANNLGRVADPDKDSVALSNISQCSQSSCYRNKTL